MKRFKLLILFFVIVFSFSNSFAQGDGKIQGVLWDTVTLQPISNATITIFRMTDSAIVNFSISSSTGVFEVDKLPFDVPLRMLFSHVSYSSARFAFTLSEENPTKNFDTLMFDRFSFQLAGAEVKGEEWDKPPITIRGDTISFNAEAFLNRPGTVVEDLLKRIPGIEFGENGITFNGRKVSSILLDGREFFGSDPTMLLKNIPSMMIDKVEVMEERDESGKIKKTGDVAINVTLKQGAKKGQFGKIFGGYGTTDRYEGGGLWNVFKDTLQISILGFSNNLSQPGFSFSDLYKLGGFNRGNLRSISSGNSSLSMNGISFGGGRGITQSFGGGVNISHVLFKKVNTNFSYFTGGNITNYTSKSIKTNLFTDSSLVNSAQNITRNTGNAHNFRLTMRGKIDTTSGYYFDASGNIVVGNNRVDLAIENYNPNTNFFNTINSLNTLENNGHEFQSSLYYYKEFKKKSKLDFGVSLSQSSSRLFNLNNQEAKTGSSILEAETFNQQKNDRLGELEFSINPSYYYEISDVFTIGTSYNLDINRYKRDIHLGQAQFGGQEFTFIDMLSGLFNNDFDNHALLLEFAYESNSEVNYYLDLGVNTLNIKSKEQLTSVSRNNIYTRPVVEAYIYKYGEKKYFSLDYSQKFETPSFNQLLPILDNVNPLLLNVGNQFLEPSYVYNVSFYRSVSNTSKGLVFMVNSSQSLTENPIMSQITFDELGRERASYRNYAEGNAYSSNNSISVNKTFKYKAKLTFPLGLRIGGRYMQNYQEINNEINKTDFLGATLTTSLGISKKDVFDFTSRYTFADNRSNASISDRFTRNISHSLTSTLWLKLPKGFSIEYDYTFNYQPFIGFGLTDGYNLFHFALNKSILKDNKGVLKLSVFDMFNQNIAITRNVSQNYISESETNAVVRYFMLSFVYNMNSLSSAEKTKSSKANNIYWW